MLKVDKLSRSNNRAFQNLTETMPLIMNKRIIAMAVIVLVGLSTFASTKTSEPYKNQETHAQASQESKPSEPVNVPQEPQKPADQPEIEPEKPVTWESNPNNCDQSKQYIAAEAPFNCIDKPVQPVTQQVATAPTARSISGTKQDWMRAAGIPESDWWAVDYIVSKESSWNPNAVNRNGGACGLAQALPCSKLGPNWNDPVTALAWQYNYVTQRYGGYAGAYSFWVVNHWY